MGAYQFHHSRLVRGDIGILAGKAVWEPFALGPKSFVGPWVENRYPTAIEIIRIAGGNGRATGARDRGDLGVKLG
jgi:hypothetical protein